MLTVHIPRVEFYDEALGEFTETEPVTLDLEHSLVSVSKWESRYCKPFLTQENRSTAETLDYIRDMTLTPGVDPKVYQALPEQVLREIGEYISSPQTATTITEVGVKPTRQVITSELIYYWMVALTIPFECENWHINRLLMLIRVCNAKNSTKDKVNRADLLARNRRLNEERKALYGTNG